MYNCIFSTYCKTAKKDYFTLYLDKVLFIWRKLDGYMSTSLTYLLQKQEKTFWVIVALVMLPSIFTQAPRLTNPLEGDFINKSTLKMQSLSVRME